MSHPGVACPFPGWAPFSAEYADYFVGRTGASRIVADALLARRVTVLYGASGTGKTSLICAGLIRQLDKRSRWPHEPIVCSAWARGASACLRAELKAVLDPARAQQPLSALLQDAAAQLEGRLLLVFDQFEELFALPGALDAEFVHAIATADPKVKVLVSIREDALAELERLGREIPGIFEHLIPLRPLSEAAGRAAITEPVKRWNETAAQAVVLEPKLIDEVLKGSTIEQADRTELQTTRLQLAMTRLWEESERSPAAVRTLRLETFKRLGGVEGIVAGHVEAALAAFSARERDRIDEMFSGLITPTGAKVPLTAADLVGYADLSEDEATRIANGLTRGVRLLEPVGDAHYQLAHDALAAPISAWRARWGKRRRKRLEWRRLFTVMLFTAALLLLATVTHILRPLELASVDARFALRGAVAPPRDVVLVKIDDASLKRLKQEWPIPRATEGKAIHYIGKGNPRVIAYDVDFSGPGSETQSREAALRAQQSLALAVSESANHIVLAAEATAPGGNVDVLGGTPGLAELGARPGYSQFPFDTNGVIRHPVYAVDGVRSFAVATAEVASGRRVRPDGVERAWIDYYGPEGAFRSVPFWEVLEHHIPSSFFANKIVVVGLTTPAHDRHAVWGTQNSDMSGAEVQANAIETIRRGLPLRSSPAWLGVALIVAFALLPALPRPRFAGVYASLLLTLGTALLYLGVAVLAFAEGTVLPIVAPLTALLLAAFALTLLATVPARPPSPRPPERPQ
jgi:CHASE2 domain-containing sensor protein